MKSAIILRHSNDLHMGSRPWQTSLEYISDHDMPRYSNSGNHFFLKSHVICLPFVRLSSFPVSGYTVLCVLCTTKLWCSYVMETKEERLVVYLSVCLSVSLSVNLSTAVYSWYRPGSCFIKELATNLYIYLVFRNVFKSTKIEIKLNNWIIIYVYFFSFSSFSFCLGVNNTLWMAFLYVSEDRKFFCKRMPCMACRSLLKN